MRLHFSHPAYDEQLLRVIAHTYYGCADIGECLAVAHRIGDGDFDCWYREWRSCGNARFNEGEAAEELGHRASAAAAYLRASNYFRVATYFDLRPDPDERLATTFALHCEAFRRAMALLEFSPKVVRIACGDLTLPGYFYKARGVRGPRPTLIFNGGYHSSHQEAYFCFVQAALQRGYHLLAFDGPGQGSLLINDGVAMRHDWESVIHPVVNYLLTRHDVDKKQLILIGQSWGGLLATRAAAFDTRIAALIVNPGYYNTMEAMKKALRGNDTALINDSSEACRALDTMLQAAMKDKCIAAKFLTKMAVHGVATPRELFAEWEKFSLAGIAEQVSCPTLVCDSENEHLAAPQAKQLYNALTCPKSYLLFSNSEGGGSHCAAGASALLAYRLFNWLDSTLAASTASRRVETAASNHTGVNSNL